MIRANQLLGFQARYHRNGVGGEGFYLCRFTYRAGGAAHRMSAVVFDGPGRVAVTTENINERWRGDDLEKALRWSIAVLDRDHPGVTHIAKAARQ